MYKNITAKLEHFNLICVSTEDEVKLSKRVKYECLQGHKNDLAVTSFNNKTRPALMNSSTAAKRPSTGSKPLVISLCQTCQNFHVHKLEMEPRFAELGFELLSFEYDKEGNRRVNYKCSCGNISSCDWRQIKNPKRTNSCLACQNNKNKISYSTLASTFSSANCELLTHPQEYVNNKQKLKYVCTCGNTAEIVYHDFVIGKRCGLCKSQRTRETNLEKYGVENTFQAEEFKEKIRQTHLERLGVEYPQQSPEIRAKTETTCLERYGYKRAFVAPEVYDKIKQIFRARYGAEYPMQCKKILEKIKLVCQERYGAEYFVQSEEYKKMMLEKYGTEYFVQSEEYKRMMLERYGTEYFVQSEEYKRMMLERYGAECPMQCPELFRKAAASSFKRKPYIYKDKTFMLLGYEDRALDDLLKENDIQVIYAGECEEIPVFKYIHGDKQRVYYPDMYVPQYNKIVEVKSIYTYNKDPEKTKLKAHHVSGLYTFELRIYNAKNLQYVVEVINGVENFVFGEKFALGEKI
jgi:hypothetical protein